MKFVSGEYSALAALSAFQTQGMSDSQGSLINLRDFDYSRCKATNMMEWDKIWAINKQKPPPHGSVPDMVLTCPDYIIVTYCD